MRTAERKSAKIDLVSIRKMRKEVNLLLRTALPQSAKRVLCGMVEALTMAAGVYEGFGNNYWMTYTGGDTLGGRGYEQWMNSYTPEGPEKLKFIIGPDGANNADNPDFVGTIEGEYSRMYYGT